MKARYEKLDNEMRDVLTDLQVRELEKEPLPKLAKDIEKLKMKQGEIKSVRSELDKFMDVFAG